MIRKYFIKQRRTILFLQIVFLVSFVSFVSSASSYESSYGSEKEEIRMIVGDVQTVKTRDLTRVSITSPDVADVLEVNSSEISILGKRPGKTELFIWDRGGKSSVRVWVFQETLELVEMRLNELLRTTKIENLTLEKNEMEGKIVVSGELEEEKLKEYQQVIAPFSESLINLVRAQEEKELIEIDVQVVEMNASYVKNLGVEWTNSFTYTETLPEATGKSADWFKLGDFNRTPAITAKINAAITEGKAKVLSRPKIVVKSGEDASFHVGGEIPIRTTTISTEGTVENITFKSYGVDLSIKATVKNDENIDVDLNITISDLDASITTASGETAYTDRSAETKLFLGDGQTVILAGFIKENNAENIKRVPFLSDIPIVGALFRNKSNDPNKTTELFVSLTPRIIARRNQEKTKEKDIEEKQSVEEIVKELGFSGDGKSAKEEPAAPNPDSPVYQSTSVPGSMASYSRRMQEKIARKVVYPQAAKDDKQQGQVVLDISVHRDGGLLSVFVRESSGNTLLDEAALQTVRQNSPYGPFPEVVSAEKLTITIPIVYRLE